jgi:hypothetical protein
VGADFTQVTELAGAEISAEQLADAINKACKVGTTEFDGRSHNAFQ